MLDQAGPEDSLILVGSHLQALWQVIKNSGPFVVRHLSVAANSLLIPIILEKNPRAIEAYIASKFFSEAIIGAGDECLYAILICSLGHNNNRPHEVGIYYRKGVLYLSGVSVLVSLLSLTVPFIISHSGASETVRKDLFDNTSIMMGQHVSKVSVTFLIHFMNVINKDTQWFNMSLQALSSTASLVVVYWLTTENNFAFENYLSTSIVINSLAILAVSVYLSINPKLKKYKLNNWRDILQHLDYLKDLLKIGLPICATGTLNKVTLPFILFLMGGSANTLKLIKLPLILEKPGALLAKIVHKSSSILFTPAYFNDDMDSARFFYNIGRGFMVGSMCVVLIGYVICGKFLLSTQAVSNQTAFNNTTVAKTISSSSSLHFLWLFGAIETLKFSAEGMAIWLDASKQTKKTMLVILAASLSTIVAASLAYAADLDPALIYGSQLLGGVIAVLLLKKIVSDEQDFAFKHGPRELFSFDYESLEPVGERRKLLEERKFPLVTYGV